MSATTTTRNESLGATAQAMTNLARAGNSTLPLVRKRDPSRARLVVCQMATLKVDQRPESGGGLALTSSLGASAAATISSKTNTLPVSQCGPMVVARVSALASVASEANWEVAYKKSASSKLKCARVGRRIQVAPRAPPSRRRARSPLWQPLDWPLGAPTGRVYGQTLWALLDLWSRFELANCDSQL